MWDSCPSQIIDEIIYNFERAKYFTIPDANKRYYQIQLNEAGAEKQRSIIWAPFRVYQDSFRIMQ